MVRPYVPASVLTWLQREHEKLERKGFPKKEVLAHSIAEELLFRKHNVPEEVMDQILVDHEEYESGRLLSRNPAIRAAAY